MSMITNRLDKIEARLQLLIEGRLARLLPIQATQGDLARQLVEAMHAGIQVRDDGQSIAPNLFILATHPTQAANLIENQALLQELADTIRDASAEAGFNFITSPLIDIAPNEYLNPNQIEIIAQIFTPQLGATIPMRINAEGDIASVPSNAFFIINGMEVFNLVSPVVNIGRRIDNQLVIDDPRVSREHAQLRANNGLYIIFDLNSTGGTFINKKRIKQGVLRPGDVVSLAGIPLVYGQEISKHLGSTKELKPLE